MVLLWVLAAADVICVIRLIAVIGNDSDSDLNKTIDGFDHDTLKIGEADTAEQARRYAGDMKVHYDALKSELPECSLEFYRNDCNDAWEHIHDPEQAEWEELASSVLDKFIQSYENIVHCDMRNVDNLYEEKRRCISLWCEYFSTLDANPDRHITVYPKTYIKEYLGNLMKLPVEDATSAEFNAVIRNCL